MSKKTKSLYPIFVITFFVLFSSIVTSTVFAITWQESGFEGGTISPFDTEISSNNTAIVEAPLFGARKGSLAEKFIWNRQFYNGSRVTKGVESVTTGGRIKEEGWFGLSFYLPSNAFPIDKFTIIAQMHAYTSSVNPDKTLTLGVEGSTGKLYTSFNYGNGSTLISNSTYYLTDGVVPRDQWVDVIFHVKFSRNNTGLYQVWYNGAPKETPTIDLNNINIGFDAWTGDSLLNGTYQKWGMYCWDDENYRPWESRTIYFDQVSYLDYTAINAWSAVNPGLDLQP